MWFYRSDLAGVVGYVIVPVAVFLKALTDVLFSVCVSFVLEVFCVPCVSSLVSESAFLFTVDERRMSFLTFSCSSDVVEYFGRRRSLRCRSLFGDLFGVVHFLVISSTFSKCSAGSGIS